VISVGVHTADAARQWFTRPRRQGTIEELIELASQVGEHQ
jgi:hypothetical protein